MDEELGWVKDKTPYVLFKCTKCNQYLYVKTIQNMKKCLRCGAIHKVKKIIKTGEIVYGLSHAIEMIKKRQHEIAIKELGHFLEFNSFHKFKIRKPQEDSKKQNSDKKCTKDFSSSFITMLDEIQKQYSKFPLYIIELKAEDYGIPKEELKVLINNLLLKGLLIKTKNGLFSIEKERITLSRIKQ